MVLCRAQVGDNGILASNSMYTTIIVIFAVTYLAIAFEHILRINKSASALFGATILWTIYALNSSNTQLVNADLAHSLISTAQIVFFLMGAMVIVEVIDVHQGFDVVTSRIKTQHLGKLLWLVSWITFFLSSVLDNLTTAIVMVSMLRKLLKNRTERLFFSGMIVIAANAGGAWSPIGDVTTTMLWIGGQVTAGEIMKKLFIPSVVNLLIPLLIASWLFRAKKVIPPDHEEMLEASNSSVTERNLMFFLGLGVLILVPVFKTVTHLPPFLGMFLGVGLLWAVGDYLHKDKPVEVKNQLEFSASLSRIDMSSITFFIGILLAVATLEHTHLLSDFARVLDQTIGREDYIVMTIGLISAVIDNVPLVAAAMGMYSLEQYPADSFIWEFLAYCAGTGGSILIIGSAAGVAAMGIEKIDFLWYLKKIGLLAILGYLGGALVYLALFG
jgi:Na+/H+ antiporter NhaD/arsenite permease-like protein